MKAKSWIIALFFVGIVFVSGCTDSEDKGSDSITTAEGIEASFAPGAPPETISEGDQFDISVSLDNRGEYTTPKEFISVSLLGVNPASFTSGASLAATQTISGASLQGSSVLNGEIIPGAEEFVEWGNVKYNVPISSDQKLNFVAQVSYLYQTITSLEGCFNSNPYVQTTGAETCKVSGEKDFYNTGAPVRVTKVEESPAGNDKFTFVFNIKNEGAGTVFARDKFSSATDLAVQDLNKVEVLGVFLGGVQNTCNGALPIGTAKTIRLGEDGGRFICTVNVGAAGSYDYKEVIQVMLSYGYNEQVRKTVTVRNIIGDSLAVGAGSGGSGSSGDSGTGDSGTPSTPPNTPTSQAAVCSDSDGGKIHTKGGVTTYTPLGGNSPREYTDYCDGITIFENYCDDDNMIYTEQVSCADLGYEECITIDGKGKCSGLVRTCDDTDNGYVLHSPGIVTTTGGDTWPDHCSDDYTLTENYCNEFNTIAYNTTDCRLEGYATCELNSENVGYCTGVAPKLCDDSDGGYDIETPGVLLLRTSVTSDSSTRWPDNCDTSTNTIIEYYCAGGSNDYTLGTKVMKCTDAGYTSCELDSNNEGRCTGPTECTDSDGGKDYGVKGTAVDTSKTVEDSCSDSTGIAKLQEYSCGPGTFDGTIGIKFEEHICESNVCGDGFCIPA